MLGGGELLSRWIISGCVLVCFPVWPEAACGGEGLCQLKLPGHSSSLREVRTGTQAETSEECCLLFTLAPRLASFLPQPRPASLGLVGWALSHQSLATGQSGGGSSPVEVPSPQVTPVLSSLRQRLTVAGLDDKRSPHMFC